MQTAEPSQLVCRIIDCIEMYGIIVYLSNFRFIANNKMLYFPTDLNCLLEERANNDLLAPFKVSH